MRFPWQRYYIKIVSQEKISPLFGEDYWMGCTSNYGYGYLSHPPWRIRYFKALAEQILSPRPVSVVEIGCARGDVLRFVKEAGVPVAGIDISPWAVEHRVIEEVLSGRAQKLPFLNKSFDLYFSHDVMEHIPVRDIPKVAAEMRRVAKRALLVISCQSLPDDIDVTHVTMMPLEWWQQQLCYDDFPVKLVKKEGQVRWNWPTLKRAWRRLWLP